MLFTIYPKVKDYNCKKTFKSATEGAVRGRCGHSFYSSLSCSIVTYKYGFCAGPGLLFQDDKAVSMLS